jgi:tripartite-type tricarboxylate transporter receptor subunit TctC
VIAAYAANTTLYPKLPYDPKKDLIPVSLIGVAPLMAAVNNNAPFKTAPELVAYAKRNPGRSASARAGTARRHT